MAKSQDKTFLTLLIYALLAGAIVTYAFPAIKVDLPPIVTENWSPLDMTKSLPKAFSQKETKWPRIKLDHDFVDVLLRLLPKDENNLPSKDSIRFFLGVLVPISLFLTYFILLFGVLLVYAGKDGVFKFIAGLGVFSAGYAVAGTFYLSRTAENLFNESISRVAEGFAGAVTKSFVQRITIQPDYGLYLLLGLTLLIFLVQAIRK